MSISMPPTRTKTRFSTTPSEPDTNPPPTVTNQLTSYFNRYYHNFQTFNSLQRFNRKLAIFFGSVWLNVEIEMNL